MEKELWLEELPGLLERARARLSPQDYEVLERIVFMGQALGELALLERPNEEIVTVLQRLEPQAPSGTGPDSAGPECSRSPAQRQPPKPSCR